MNAEARGLQILEQGGAVFVHIHPEKKLNRKQLSDQILLELKSQGFDNYYIFPDILDKISSSEHQTFTSYKLAEKRDAHIEIELEEDEMTAWLTVAHAWGGESPNIEKIKHALDTKGIIHGIKEDVISLAVSQGEIDRTIVASGDVVEQGQNAWFEYLIKEEEAAPKIQQNGKVDYHELNYVTSIVAGTPLMRKHPATPGQAGKTVTGIELPAAPGKDKHLAESKGSIISETDPHLLMAEKGGSPTKGSNTVRVEDIFQVSQVDVETGNIVFNGTVIISGNVASGFTVKAHEDIEIQGTVEAAFLEAGGNILIHTGVAGNKQTKIIAGKNIHARFIENATVECGNDLLVQDSLLHCESRAGNQVLVGIDGGKGQLNGGHVFATRLIKANIYGSKSSTATVLTVGPSAYFMQKMTDIKQELANIRHDLEETIKTIIYIRTRAQEKKDHLPTLEEEREALSTQIHILTEKLEHLQLLQTTSARQCKIVAREKLYPGVKMCFSEHTREIEEDYPASVFSLLKSPEGDETISTGPLHKTDLDWN